MKKFQIPKIKKIKNPSEKLICLTAYDAFTAHVLEVVEVDLVLVGDSLGNVVQGNETTISVTLDEIIYHSKIVRHNYTDGLIIVDMPFGTYGHNVDDSIKNCIKVFKETNCNGIKMEGACDVILRSIKSLINIGVPVMGHLGFTPQSINIFGGAKIVGKKSDTINRILKEAKMLEDAGVFSIVLECMTEDLAKQITNLVKVPTIGIGAGNDVDGQILVINDLLGMTIEQIPSFVKPHANILETAKNAVRRWKDNIKKGIE